MNATEIRVLFIQSFFFDVDKAFKDQSELLPLLNVQMQTVLIRVDPFSSRERAPILEYLSCNISVMKTLNQMVKMTLLAFDSC